MRPLLAHACSLSILTALSLIPETAKAQDCDCDHELATSVTSFDGAAAGVKPGDRICVMAGKREFLRFQRIQGTESERIEIINCGGLVEIFNATRAYALVFEDDSRFFRVTGTGDPAITYGFNISAPAKEPYPGVGLWTLGKSTNYEADHLEIHHTGFAGVSAKTDPLCDGSADQDVFVQRNVELHHLYIHDTGGEGFYVGSTQANGQTITCDGTQEVHQPHFLEGISLHHNLVENTGWDGAQVGMARSDCHVYNNVIRNVGLEGVQYQQQGLQIGAFSACEIWGNVLEGGPTNGIFVLGAHQTSVYNNVVVDFAGTGIYANQQDFGAGYGYRIWFNTIVNAADGAVKLFGPDLVANELKSNFAVGGDPAIAAGGDVDVAKAANLELASLAEAKFLGVGDYHIAIDSPANGAGEAVAEVTLDHDGRQRGTPPSAGALEYTDDPGPVDGGAVGGAGFGGSAQGGSAQGGSAQGGSAQGGSAQGGSAQGGSAQGGSGAGTSGGASATGGGSGSSDSGGCGCSVSAPRSANAWTLLLVLGGLLVRRRRIKQTRS